MELFLLSTLQKRLQNMFYMYHEYIELILALADTKGWDIGIRTARRECRCTSWDEPLEQISRLSACWQRRQWIPPEPEDSAGWSSCSSSGQCWEILCCQPGIYGMTKKNQTWAVLHWRLAGPWYYWTHPKLSIGVCCETAEGLFSLRELKKGKNLFK